MKNRLIKQKALFEIFLVISLTFYTSLSFAALNQPSSNLEKENKINYLDLIKQDLFPNVDAQNKVCCKTTKQDSVYKGESCVYTEETNCASNLQPGEKLAISCPQTDYCAPGVCKLAGACSDNVEKGICLQNGGIWNTGTSESDPQCKIGCCDLPSGASITTQAQCLDKIKPFPNIQDVNEVFKSEITDQTQCLQQSRSNEEGCCVISDQNSCEFTTAQQCRDSEGEFRGKGVLCSTPGLNCQVTPKQGTACYQNNKVYWVDSAGNRENVYDGNFNPTWEYTNWLQVTDITQIDTLAKRNPKALADVAVSGNCQFSLGTTCGEVEDNVKNYLKNNKGLQSNDLNKLENQCINLDCKLENGNILRNGESFCLYDSQSGQGRDLVGSGHSLQRCDNGVLKPEFCDDRRKTICVQNEVPRNLIDPNDKNKQPSTFASCIPNDWQLCLAANSDNENCGVEDPKGVYNSLYGEGGPCKDLKKDNDQYNSCVNKLVCRKEACENQAVGYCYFNANVGLCAPSVPPGTLGIEEKYEELSDGNKIGFSFDPIMFFAEKSSLGGNPEWGEDCVAGCDVNTREFADRWNSYCKGLGDLGANYNVVGYYNKLGLFHNGPINNDNVDDVGDSAKAQGASDKDANYYNSLIRNKNIPLRGENNFFSLISTIDILKTIYFENVNNRAFLPGFFEQGWTWVYSAVGLGAVALGSFLAFGITFAGAGALPFAIAKYLGISFLGPAAAPVLVVVAIVVVVYTLLNWLFGPEAGSLTYELTCRSWVPEDKGNNCDLCNDESKFQECNEYICNSLGKACSLLNKGNPGLETCVWDRKGETTPPFIAPSDIINQNDIEKVPESTGISGGYKFKKSFTAYTDVEIGIKIVRRDNPNEKDYAECKISRFNDFDYEQSQNFFEDNLVRHEHTREIGFIASPILPEEDRIELEPGKTNTFYIKCKNVNGRENTKPYFIEIPVNAGPDTAPPEVKSFSIKNNAFMPYNLDKTPFTMYVEDKSGLRGCKYSTIKGQNYEIMSYNMSCVRDSRLGIDQYACYTVLNLRPNQENTFYFKCRDRANNTNPIDFPPIEGDTTDGYHLFSSQPLDVSQAGPSGDILTTDVKLTMITAEGAEDGKATCYYAGGEKSSIAGFGDLTFSPSGIKFTTTDASSHETELSLLNEKDYVFYLWCRDIAGNEDNTKVEFHKTTPDLNITNVAPTSAKIYSGKVQFQVTTVGGTRSNGDSDCTYRSTGTLYGGSGNINDFKIKTTLETTHHKNVTLSDGSYEFEVECVDNVIYKRDKKKVNFEVDTTGTPKLIRVYKDAGLLNILTDRQSECRYSLDNRGFDYNTASLVMVSSNNNLQHSLQIANSKAFYIKCQDLNTKQINAQSYTIYP